MRRSHDLPACSRLASLRVQRARGRRAAGCLDLRPSRDGDLEFHRRRAGAVRRRRAGRLVASHRGGYDIVVTVTGPRQTMVTFRKERGLGIWVNADSRAFEKAPSYLAVLSNRPLDAIASDETLRRLQLGLTTFALPQRASVNIADAGSDDPFRMAFIKLLRDRGLYREVANGVTFLTPTLFRASIPLPAEVQVGTYEVDVRLLADGMQIARAPAPFEVYKSGFEQIVSEAPRVTTA